MRKKLSSADGLTLVEMLCAVVVLILLGLILNAGFQMAVRSYRIIVAQSEAELLLSTAVNALSDDLRYARDVAVDGGGKLDTYLSDSFGAGTTLKIDPATGHILANGKQLLPPGRTLAGGGAAGGAYKGNAYKAVEPMDITYSEASGIFTVKLKIVWTEDEDVGAEAEFSVRSLNHKEETP